MRSAFLDYAFALTPAAVTVGGFNLAYWAKGYFHCGYAPKSPRPCQVNGFDITPLIEFGKWGLLWLIPVGLFLSLLLCIRVSIYRRRDSEK